MHVYTIFIYKLLTVYYKYFTLVQTSSSFVQSTETEDNLHDDFTDLSVFLLYVNTCLCNIC